MIFPPCSIELGHRDASVASFGQSLTIAINWDFWNEIVIEFCKSESVFNFERYISWKLFFLFILSINELLW